MKTTGVTIFITLSITSSVLSITTNTLHKRWGHQMIYKMPYESNEQKKRRNEVNCPIYVNMNYQQTSFSVERIINLQQSDEA